MKPLHAGLIGGITCLLAGAVAAYFTLPFLIVNVVLLALYFLWAFYSPTNSTQMLFVRLAPAIFVTAILVLLMVLQGHL